MSIIGVPVFPTADFSSNVSARDMRRARRSMSILMVSFETIPSETDENFQISILVVRYELLLKTHFAEHMMTAYSGVIGQRRGYDRSSATVHAAVAASKSSIITHVELDLCFSI